MIITANMVRRYGSSKWNFAGICIAEQEQFLQQTGILTISEMANIKFISLPSWKIDFSNQKSSS